MKIFEKSGVSKKWNLFLKVFWQPRNFQNISFFRGGKKWKYFKSFGVGKKMEII